MKPLNMDDGKEHTNIVEFYPLRFEERSDPLLHDDGLCYIKIYGTHISRTVYRPLIGPDMLLAQKEVTRTYDFPMKFELPGSRSDLYDTFRMIFLADELGDYWNLHPDWNLENLAENICQYAESQGFCLQGRAPQLFELTAVEAFVELSIMSEAAGWRMSVWKEGLAPAPPIDIVECTLCHHQDMTHGNSIALNCGDVFHKHCFFPLWWEDKGTNCPQCARKCL